MTGWHGDAPFVDPLCGSGTLCIEAAWIALRRPPGLTRRRFGFMGWINFDIALWTELRDQARRQMLTHLDHTIGGFDQRRDAVQFARGNAKAAGIGNLVRFDIKDLRDFRPPDGAAGVLLCNPPYGERLGEEKELKSLYKEMGSVFREVCRGWRVHVFTGNAFLARQIGLKPTRQIHLFNGKIPCRLLEFEV